MRQQANNKFSIPYIPIGGDHVSKPGKNIVHELVEDSWGRVALESDSGGSLESKLTAVASAMVIAIGKEFGVSLDEAAASKVLDKCGYPDGVSASFKALDAANISYPFTIPAKMAIAVVEIEAAGNLVYDYFDKKYG